MPQTRKLVGALGIVFGLAVLAFAITAGGAHQAFGQQTTTPSAGGTTAAGTGTTTSGTPAAGTTGTSAAGTPAAAGTSITTTGTRTATTGSPTAGAAAGASTLPSSGTGDDGGSSTSMIWMIAAGTLVALFGAGMLTSGLRKRR